MLIRFTILPPILDNKITSQSRNSEKLSNLFNTVFIFSRLLFKTKALNPPEDKSVAGVCWRFWLLSETGCSGRFWVAMLDFCGGTGVEGWEEGCVRSSGGGTGKTTGLEELDSLFISSTWIGPEWLFRLIWYFFCPFWPFEVSRHKQMNKGQHFLVSWNIKNKTGKAIGTNYDKIKSLSQNIETKSRMGYWVLLNHLPQKVSFS